MNYDFEINIVHYEKLHQKEKDSLIRELEGKNIKFNFIEKFDREKLTKENLEKFTNDINNAYKANFLSHIECYKNLLESKYNYTLILEDDSLPKQIFYRKINSYLKQLPKNFDLFYISDGKSNFKIPIYKKIPFKNVYFKKISIQSGEVPVHLNLLTDTLYLEIVPKNFYMNLIKKNIK